MKLYFELKRFLIENIGYHCSNLKKQTINESFPIFTDRNWQMIQEDKIFFNFFTLKY